MCVCVYTELAPKLSATASVAQWYITGLVIQQRRMIDSQLEGLGVAYFATVPRLRLIMYINMTLDFLHITLTFIY